MPMNNNPEPTPEQRIVQEVDAFFAEEEQTGHIQQIAESEQYIFDPDAIIEDPFVEVDYEDTD